jgi:hypothetical protein
VARYEGDEHGREDGAADHMEEDVVPGLFWTDVKICGPQIMWRKM